MAAEKQIYLGARLEGGKAPVMTWWCMTWETAPLKDVLRRPAESFR